MRIALVTAVIACFAGPALAQVALDFKGLAFGQASEEDLRQVVLDGPVSSWYCGTRQEGVVWNTCQAKETRFAGEKVDLMAQFLDGRLGWISMSFDPERFDAILSALSEKYGKPRLRQSTTRTRGGQDLSQTEADWNVAGGASLSMRRYGQSRDAGSITMYGAEARAQLLRDIKAKGDKAKKDI